MKVFRYEELDKIIYGKYYMQPIGSGPLYDPTWAYFEYLKTLTIDGCSTYIKLANNPETNNGNNIGANGLKLKDIKGAMILLSIISPYSILIRAKVPMDCIILFDPRLLIKALVENIKILQFLDNLAIDTDMVLDVDICKAYDIACYAVSNSKDYVAYSKVSDLSLSEDFRETLDRYINGTYGVNSNNIKIVTSYLAINRVVKAIIGIIYARFVACDFIKSHDRLTRFIYSMASQLNPKLILTVKETREYDVIKAEIDELISNTRLALHEDGLTTGIKEYKTSLITKATSFEFSTELLIRELIMIGAYAPDIMFKVLPLNAKVNALTIKGLGELFNYAVRWAISQPVNSRLSTKQGKAKLRANSISNIRFFNQIFYLVDKYPFILGEGMRAKDKRLAQIIKEHGYDSEEVNDYLFRMKDKLSLS